MEQKKIDAEIANRNREKQLEEQKIELEKTKVETEHQKVLAEQEWEKQKESRKNEQKRESVKRVYSVVLNSLYYFETIKTLKTTRTALNDSQ